MAKINKDNIKCLIATMKGIAPANYESMERLVASVDYLKTLLEEPDEEKAEEVMEDG